MFGEYSQDERASVAMVVALSLPVEVSPVSSEDMSSSGEEVSSIDGRTELMSSRHPDSWNMALIENMCLHLDISTRKLAASFEFIYSVDKYRPLSTEERRLLSSPYCQHLFSHDSPDVREIRCAKLYVQILVCVVLLNKYDGRGRVLLRNLYGLLALSPARYVWIESSLCQFLLEKESALQHAKTKGSSKYRYAKIGAVALGAGAVLAVTGGLAAPAIAGALLLMGSSTAAAATITGSSVMMVLFGGAGAGLAGYKMTRRTLGLTEFEFRTYGDPGKLAMVLMVAGFMENDEDDKRSFGVLPDELSLKERLTRYYSIHASDRLEKVDNEVLCFEDDPQPLFDHLNSLYGKDPLSRDSFMQHHHASPFEDAAEQQLHLGFITEAIQHYLQQPTGTPPGGSDRRRGTHGMDGGGDDQLVLTRDLGAVVRNEGYIDTAGSRGNLIPLSSGEDESLISDTVDVKEAVDGPQLCLSQKNDGNAALGEMGVDLGLSQTCWSWSELDISPMYELNILHWETRLLKQMGGTIHNLARSISTTAARKAVETTIMNLVALTAALPLYLLSVVNTIDSMWVIASERAAATGKEMATALLSRPPGMRPVTLIGYSMGAKVIFYCLKEMYRQLCMSDMSPSTSCEELREAALDEDDDDDLQSGDPDWVSDDREPRGSVTPSDRPGFVPRPAALDDSKPKPSYFGFLRRKSASSEPTLIDAMNAKGGLIQDVVLLGCPINAKSRYWDKIRRLVSGRLINGYSTKDTLLSLVYRYEQLRFSIAGIQPVDILGVENIDLSHIVQQHAHYSTKMAAILREIDLASAGT